jgi:hypothetical protein
LVLAGQKTELATGTVFGVAMVGATAAGKNQGRLKIGATRQQSRGATREEFQAVR